MGLTDHSVRIYDVVTKELKSDVINEDSSVLCMCLDTNNRLIIGTVDKTITVWDLKEGKKTNSLFCDLKAYPNLFHFVIQNSKQISSYN